jgi:nucleoside-diphosphate-sugar epimerase
MARRGRKTPMLALPIPVPLAPQFDSSRAKQELGWRPRSLVDGVRDTFRLEGRG